MKNSGKNIEKKTKNTNQRNFNNKTHDAYGTLKSHTIMSQNSKYLINHP